VPGTKNHKLGDRVRITWDDPKQYGALGTIERVDHQYNNYLIRLDDPEKSYNSPKSEIAGCARHDDNKLEAVVSEFKKGDEVRISWKSSIDPGAGILDGQTVVVALRFSNGNYQVELNDKLAAEYGSRFAVFTPDHLKLASNHDGFKDRLFAYLTAKDSRERQAFLTEIGKGWWWSDEKLYRYVTERLNRNRDGWCKDGVDNAREALGIVAPLKAATFTITVKYGDYLPSSFEASTKRFIEDNFGAVKEAVVERNK
jgi:hypothetical protein